VPWCDGEGKLAWLPKIDFVRVPHYVLNAVCFLGWNETPGDPATEVFGGTGFTVVVEKAGIAFCYLVTADHVARELERAKEPIVKLNDGDGLGYHYRLKTPLTLDLQGKARNIPAWYRHPSDDSADIAVTNFLPSWATDWKPFKPLPYVPTSMFIRDDELHPVRGTVGIGDEVFMTGLFTHVAGEDSNTPICRVGNVAMLPRDRIYTGSSYGYMEAFLIETRSIGGISGAPVFVRGTHEVKAVSNLEHFDNWKMIDLDAKGVAPSSVYSLLGIAHGHWNIRPDDISAPNFSFVRSSLNVGIGIVTPARKIMETLNHPSLVAEREDVAKEVAKKKRSAVQDSADAEEPFTREDFLADLKRAAAFRQRSDD
jgi:hypothetical protein